MYIHVSSLLLFLKRCSTLYTRLDIITVCSHVHVYVYMNNPLVLNATYVCTCIYIRAQRKKQIHVKEDTHDDAHIVNHNIKFF